MEVTVAAAVPVLDTVTADTALAAPTVVAAKVSEAGFADSAAVAVDVPVPASVTVDGLLVALPAMVRVPVREPTAVGWNVTVTVQFAPAASVAPQVVARVKSPLAVMAERFAVAVPVLVTVTLCQSS